MCAQKNFRGKFIRCEFAFTVFRSSGGVDVGEKQKVFLFIFPTHQPDDCDLFSIEFEQQKHIASCGSKCSANQAPSILNQITIEIGWFHSALRLLLRCMLEIWLFIFALFSLKKHPLVVVLCLLGAFHLFRVLLFDWLWQGRNRDALKDDVAWASLNDRTFSKQNRRKKVK